MSNPTFKKILDPIIAKYTDPKTENYVPNISCGVVTKKDGLVYLGASGVNSIDHPENKTNEDTIFAFFSTTKAMTATAIVQLIEQGKLGLDDLAEKYSDEFKKVQLYTGKKDADGNVVLTKPKNKITIRHLLTHTAGFTYGFFNKHVGEQVPVGASAVPDKMASIKYPLYFEPGTNWHYGTNIDWLGHIVQQITGDPLGTYLKKNVYSRIGADSLTFHKVGKYTNEALIHERLPDGSLKVYPGQVEPNPEFDFGGHGCFGKVKDYLKFLEIFLHDGKCPSTGEQILQPESLKNYMFKNLLPEGVHVGNTFDLPDNRFSNPVFTLDSLDPKTNGWTAAFHKIDVDSPTGRSAGSVYWCGLANLFYWIDPKKGVAGYWGTQVYPFFDGGALTANAAFETGVYEALGKY